MICTECGREIEFGIEFCYYCGEELPNNVEKQEKYEFETNNVSQASAILNVSNTTSNISYKDFPSVFESKTRDDEKERMKQAEQTKNTNIGALQKGVNGTKKIGAEDIFAGAFVGGIIGFVVWLIVFFFTLSIHLSLLPFVLLGAIAGIIKEVSNIQSNNEKCQKVYNDIEKEKRIYEDKAASIKKETNNRITAYKNGFEDEAKKLSIKYAESALAQEVADWMTKGYIKTIESADRRSHVKKIDIPFRFDVYSNKITCNLGTYDFELQRCRNLDSPLEQVALARALASFIQLQITMKYPRDISGTDILINMEYVYRNSYVQTTLVYKAKNGNYESVRDWS